MPRPRTSLRLVTGALVLASVVSCGGDNSPTSPGGPGTSQTFTLTGVVTSESTGESLSGARVEVIDGRHAGKSDSTDGSGRYSISGLNGGLSVRATRDGYEGSAKGVTMTSDQTLDFALDRFEGGVKGVVTDILNGSTLGGIDVSIPNQGSVATSGNGAFSLSVSYAGAFPLNAVGGIYFKRETSVTVGSFANVELSLIPNGMGFDMSFFDHVFRWNGENPTSRWTDEPTFEIWTQEFRCEQGGADEACQRLVATDSRAPAVFINNAESVLATDVRALTGGFVRGNKVRRRSHDPGTVVAAGQMYSPEVVVIVLVRNSNTTKSWAGWQKTGTERMYSGRVQINTRHEDLRCIMSHEIAHTLGYHHPDGQYSVPKPSVMRCDGPTTDDRLHGRVLYLRPPGSRTPDKDPDWFSAGESMVSATHGPDGGLTTHEAHCGQLGER
jgi:hypothetical protein